MPSTSPASAAYAAPAPHRQAFPDRHHASEDTVGCQWVDARRLAIDAIQRRVVGLPAGIGPNVHLDASVGFQPFGQGGQVVLRGDADQETELAGMGLARR
jgi:hypothetical protein